MFACLSCRGLSLKVSFSQIERGVTYFLFFAIGKVRGSPDDALLFAVHKFKKEKIKKSKTAKKAAVKTEGELEGDLEDFERAPRTLPRQWNDIKRERMPVHSETNGAWTSNERLPDGVMTGAGSGTESSDSGQRWSDHF